MTTIDSTKPIQFILHKNAISLNTAYDITNDMLAGVVRRIDGTMSTDDFELRIPDVSIRVNDQDNTDLHAQTAYTSYYTYLNTGNSFFLEIYIYGKSEFIGKIDKSKIMQEIENGFTYTEFNVPYLLYDLNNKIVNYVGTSIGDLEGLTRFLVDNQSTQQLYEGDYYGISSTYIDVTFDRDIVEFEAIPSTGLLYIDTEIASYNNTSYQGLDVNEDMIVRFTFDTRELYNTSKSYADLEKILVVTTYNYTDIITKVIADIQTDVYLSSAATQLTDESGSAIDWANDISIKIDVGNNLINGKCECVGSKTTGAAMLKNYYYTLYDSQTIDSMNTKDDGIDRVDNAPNTSRQWARMIEGTFAPTGQAYMRYNYNNVGDGYINFYDTVNDITFLTLSTTDLGTSDNLDVINFDYNIFCTSSQGYIDSTTTNPKNFMAYHYTGKDNIYDALLLDSYDNGFNYAVIEKDSVTGYIVMRLYRGLTEGTALVDLRTWLNTGTVTDSYILATTDNVTTSGYHMYHGFVHGWGYTYNTENGTIKKITYHDNRDLIGEIIDGEIFEIAINMDSMTFDFSEVLTSYVYPQSYTPYIGILAANGNVNKRKAVGYRNMYLVNVNPTSDQSYIYKARYLYDCISYSIKNKKMLDVVNDYRKYYYAILYLNRKQEIVIKNIETLFDNVANTYTLNTDYVKKVKKEKWNFADVSIIPDSADISYAVRTFYEAETLRIFQSGKDVWTIETSEYIDAFYFDYVEYSGRLGTVIGKEINFTDTNDMTFTYTLIMESTISVFDSFAVV